MEGTEDHSGMSSRARLLKNTRLRTPSQRYHSLLATYLWPLWPRVLVMASLLAVSIGLQLLYPRVLQRFIDSVASVPVDELYLMGLFFVTTALSSQLVSLLAGYASADVGWRATNRLRSDLLQHILHLDMSFHNAHTPGELLERIDGDVSHLANFLSQFVVRIVGGGLLLFGVLTVVALDDWRLALMMGVFAAVFAVSHLKVQRIAVPFWHARAEARAGLSGFVGERLAAAREIHTCGGAAYVMRRFTEGVRRSFSTNFKAEIATDVGWSLSNILFGVGTAAALGLGAYLYGQGDVSLGGVYLVIHYLQMLRTPLNTIGSQIEDLQRARVSIERTRQLLERRSHLVDGGRRSMPDGALEVELANVAFAYQPSEPVLKGFSLRIEAGRVLGLLGKTGSGKTTLSRLLFRLYEAQSGEVRLAGADVRDYRIADLRRRIGMVTQDVQLFHGSVRDNVTLFDSSIEDDRLVESIRDVGLRDWLDALPEGLDSEVQSGGAGMSGGEAQLLAFARVHLKNPGLVILDEASSRLDPATERFLGDAMERLMAGRTSIVIAHRLSTVKRADAIAIIEEGELREYGEYSALAQDPTSILSRLLRSGLEDVLE